MNDVSELQPILFGALARLAEHRLNRARFEDEADNQGPKYYFTTLEGLEALLVPLAHLPKGQFWEPLARQYPRLKTAIIDDVKFILSYNNGIEPPAVQGQPYFRERRAADRPYWTSECCSFTVSVLVNYLELKEKSNHFVRGPSKTAILEAIGTQARWLEKCARGKKGWTWVFNGDPHPWPTWSVLDTFDELLRCDTTKGLFGARTSVGVVVPALRESLEPRGELGEQWTSNVARAGGGAYDVTTALDIARLMLAVTLHSHRREVFDIARLLFGWASETNFERVEYNYNLREHLDVIQDCSLVPSVLRALTVMAQCLEARQLDRLDKELGSDHEFVIQKVAKVLDRTRLADGPYAGLWGVRDRDRMVKYELYYSERAIEALTDLYLYVRRRGGSAPEQKATPPLASKTSINVVRGGHVDVGSNALPMDSSRFVAWIPTLAAGEVPPTLQGKAHGLTADRLLEIYLHELWRRVFFMDVQQLGHRHPGRAVPDGVLTLPDSDKKVLYDAKASTEPYDFSRDEWRKFVEYAKAAIKREPFKNSIASFLAVAQDFKGSERSLADRRAEFTAETTIHLSLVKASTLCGFAHKVLTTDQSVSKVRTVGWSKIIAAANPLIREDAFEMGFRRWQTDLNLT